MTPSIYDRPIKFSDAPMFNRVMSDKSICKDVLERILKIEIEDIEYINTEHTIEEAIGERGVRLDVFVKTTNKIFDIEMQVVSKSDLGKRMRYYQAKMDRQALGKGKYLDDLPNSYIIFICKHDAYNRAIPYYSFSMKSNEFDDLEAGCEISWIVLNSKAYQDEKDQKLSKLLEYVETGNKTEDPLIQQIDDEVKEANKDIEWRRQAMGFMTVEHDHTVELRAAEKRGLEAGLEQGLEAGRIEGLEEGLEAGRIEGQIEGQDKLATLGKILISENRTEDLNRAFSDQAFRDKLYEEYSL